MSAERPHAQPQTDGQDERLRLSCPLQQVPVGQQSGAGLAVPGGQRAQGQIVFVNAVCTPNCAWYVKPAEACSVQVMALSAASGQMATEEALSELSRLLPMAMQMLQPRPCQCEAPVPGEQDVCLTCGRPVP